MSRHWEYRTANASIDRAEVDALGLCGWELCAISGEIVWFKRDRDERMLDEQAARHAEERGKK
jgi:hypothetical protein